MRTTLIWSLLVVCALTLGSCKEGKPAPGVLLVKGLEPQARTPPCQFDLKDFHALDPCLTWDCGSNSPIVGAEEYDLKNSAASRYIIVGLKDNENQPTIQKGQRNDPQQVSTLSVASGALRADGQAISGHGWWILVKDREGQPGKKECKIDIGEVGSVQPWYGAGPLPTYTFEVERQIHHKRKLCRFSQRWRGPMRRRPHGEPAEATVADDSESYAALIVSQERYTKKAAILPENGNTFSSWFNIACAGTALSKMRLMGLDPETDPHNQHTSDRQTVLKMLTATYCQTDENIDWTEPGVPLGLSKCSSNGDCEIDLAPENAQTRTLEAYWDENGAKCFSHTRLGSSSANQYPPPRCKNINGSGTKAQKCEDFIRATCGLPECTGDHPSDWKTEAINHPEH